MEENNNINNGISDEEFMASLPPGFRFDPTDVELVIEYLRRKVLNLPLPFNKIKEVNIYAYNPEQLSGGGMGSGEKIMYFLSSRERKYAGGKRPDRTAGDGFWKASGKGKTITSNGVNIGCKTSLVYYRGTQRQGCHKKTNWLMHEYTLPQDSKPMGFGDNKVLDRWVLCRVYHSGKADKDPQPSNMASTSTQESNSQNETPYSNQIIYDMLDWDLPFLEPLPFFANPSSPWIFPHEDDQPPERILVNRCEADD